MKSIRDLEKALNNTDFYNKQFDESGIAKNILFVSPQLTGKHIYKFILPYFCLLSAKVNTAITSIEKFDAESAFKSPSMKLFPKQVLWADFIVFPFVVNPLAVVSSGKESLYSQLKKINPNVKIVYHVDFNFYELSKMHPYYKIFDKKTISNVEDNIYFSDLCLVSNTELHKFLIKTITELAQTKYAGTEPSLKVGSIPVLFDTNLLLQNVDYDPNHPVIINNKKAKEASIASEQVKKSPKKNGDNSKTKKNSYGKSTKSNAKSDGGSVENTTIRDTGSSGNAKRKRGRPRTKSK
jgi:hypothetical protein